MVEKNPVSAEFEATIDQSGQIKVPQGIVDSFLRHGMTRVQVRMRGRSLTRLLRKRGVGEEEVERISAAQLEPAEQVLKFLLVEGKLKSIRRRFGKISVR